MRLRARLVDTPTVRLECLANGNGNGTKRQTVGKYVTAMVKRGLSFWGKLCGEIVASHANAKVRTLPSNTQEKQNLPQIKPQIINFNWIPEKLNVRRKSISKVKLSKRGWVNSWPAFERHSERLPAAYAVAVAVADVDAAAPNAS